MEGSKKFRLGAKDIIHGLILAIAAPCVAIIQTSLDAGSLSVNWKLVGLTAISAGIAYLAKKFFQNDKV